MSRYDFAQSLGPLHGFFHHVFCLHAMAVVAEGYALWRQRFHIYEAFTLLAYADGGIWINIDAGVFVYDVYLAILIGNLVTRIILMHISADDIIDYVDLGDLLIAYNTVDQESDINGDDMVDYVDLGKLLINYGSESTLE